MTTMRGAVAVAVALAGCAGSADAPDAGGSPWLDGPALPGGRLEPGVVAFDGGLWVIGGFDERIASSIDTWILDGDLTAWRPGPPAPAALTHLELAVVGDTLYALGGSIGTDFIPSRAAWALDRGATTWRPLAPLPEARGAAAVIVDGTRIVLAGGAATNASLATVLVYDTVGDVWARLPELPSPRSHPVGALAPDGAALVIGGTATLDASHPLADVLALAPGAASWQARAPMPTARGGMACGRSADELICAGGEAGGAALEDTEAYDLVHDRWTTLDRLPRARAGTGGAMVDGRLWVPGGAHALRYQATAVVSSLPR